MPSHPDLIPDPEDPNFDDLGFGNYLDDVDKAAADISDEHIEQRLRATIERVQQNSTCQCPCYRDSRCATCINPPTEEDGLCTPCRVWKNSGNKGLHCHALSRFSEQLRPSSKPPRTEEASHKQSQAPTALNMYKRLKRRLFGNEQNTRV